MLLVVIDGPGLVDNGNTTLEGDNNFSDNAGGNIVNEYPIIISITYNFSGNNVIITATLTANNEPLAGRTISFYVNGKLI